jgi:hypothetical protein
LIKEIKAMRSSFLAGIVASFAIVALASLGCTTNEADKQAKSPDEKPLVVSPEKEAEIAAELNKLPEDDRREALAQKFCAIETKNRLGSMDAPFKLMIEGQPVFLCCEGCKEKALADPQATLAKVAELKKANTK